MPLPPRTTVVRVALSTLQLSYAKVFRNPRSGTFSESWCRWPIGLTFRVKGETIVVIPKDVSATCLRMVEEHELAHAKGWRHGDPGSIQLKTGTCTPHS
jgi:hypothetical protein